MTLESVAARLDVVSRVHNVALRLALRQVDVQVKLFDDRSLGLSVPTSPSTRAERVLTVTAFGSVNERGTLAVRPDAPLMEGPDAITIAEWDRAHRQQHELTRFQLDTVALASPLEVTGDLARLVDAGSLGAVGLGLLMATRALITSLPNILAELREWRRKERLLSQRRQLLENHIVELDVLERVLQLDVPRERKSQIINQMLGESYDVYGQLIESDSDDLTELNADLLSRLKSAVQQVPRPDREIVSDALVNRVGLAAVLELVTNPEVADVVETTRLTIEDAE